MSLGMSGETWCSKLFLYQVGMVTIFRFHHYHGVAVVRMWRSRQQKQGTNMKLPVADWLEKCCVSCSEIQGWI